MSTDQRDPPSSQQRLKRAVLPWLATVVYWLGLGGRLLRARLLPGLLRAAAAAAAVAGRTAVSLAAATRRAGSRARPVVAERLLPGIGFTVAVAAAFAVVAAAGLARRAERVQTAAGIAVDRWRASVADVFAVAGTVEIPAAWAALGRRMPGTAARAKALKGRGAAVLGAAAGAVGARLPSGGLGRPLGVTVGALAAAGVLALPAAHLAAGVVDLGPGMPPLAERSTVIGADGSVLGVLHGEVDRRVVGLDAIPEHVRHAVIVAEDRRFYEHPGYDPEGIGRAFVANLRAGETVQGGSTITQQLAKHNYAGHDRTVWRKVRELVYAIALERRYSKDALLERYLNEVYFGDGAYGVAAAAEEFFRRPPADLTPDQAAALAAVIRAPGTYALRADPERATKRRNDVLATMAAEGLLAPGVAADAESAPLEVAPPRDPINHPQAVEVIRRAFLANPAFGETPEQRAELLYTGGLDIHTTILPALQAHAGRVLVDPLPVEGTAAALAAVEPASGRIRAVHSGTDVPDRKFNLATQGRRQPGSAFKPFVAVAALEAGVPVSVELEGESPTTFDLGWQEWDVSNYGGSDHGTVDLHQALVDSVNVAFADLAVGLGQDPIVDVVQRLGIDPEASLGPPDRRGPSIALGGLTHGVSPLEMATAYAAFANGGRRVQPYLIEAVTDRDGQEIHRTEPTVTQALTPEVTATVAGLLADVVRSGTGTAARLPGWTPVGKTGTTQQGADAWFVGTVEPLAVAVWVGHPDGQIPIRGLTGGAAAAPLWRDFMAVALDELAAQP